MESRPSSASAAPVTAGSIEHWLIGMKLLLLAYVAVSYALRGGARGVYVVLFCLAFLCSAFLSYLLPSPAARRLFQLFSLAVSLAGFAAADPDFAVLIPISAAEPAFELTGRLYWTFVPPLIAAGFVALQDLPLYLLAACFAVAGSALLNRSKTRLEAMDREVERLRASNESLHRGAAKSAEYEDELAYLSQPEERNRLAQDIHDRVGHAIAGGIIQLEAASALLERDKDAARTMMERGAQALREGMESIRAAPHGIKPASEELGVHRIKAMLDRFSAGGSISTHLSYRGDLSAVARAVRVGIEVLNRIVKVEARDDGRGACAVVKGLGLAGIEERTEELGGKVVIDGTKGFSVIMLLPISPEEAAGRIADDDELVANAVKCGARGYPLKSSPPERIKDAIRIVADGVTVLQDAAMDRLKERLFISEGTVKTTYPRFLKKRDWITVRRSRSITSPAKPLPEPGATAPGAPHDFRHFKS
jgi:signal transduction histidine kinase